MRSIRALPFVAILAALAVFAAPALAQDGPVIGGEAPGFTLPAADGGTYTLADHRGQWVVLEWLNYDCPYVMKHYGSGNIPGQQAKWRERGVTWLAIVSSAPGKQGYYPPEEMVQQKKKHNGNMTAILMDPSGNVGKTYGATVTPHMYVINPDGELLYRGGIDDKPTTDQADIEGATNYVRGALNAAMNGEEVSPKRAEPYGCTVKYASK